MNFSMTKVDKKTGYIKSKDQTPLFYRHFETENPKAAVLLVHGFGEHGGRYDHVVERLRAEGYSIFCIDFRGHGHSQGVRGDVQAFDRYEEDVHAALVHLKESQGKDTKIFVVAHSMGALVALRMLTKMGKHVDGIVLSCPLFALKMKVPTWKKWAAIIAASVAPTVRVKTGIRGKHLSSDLSVAQAYDHDPLVLKNLSARAFYEIYQGCLSADELSGTLKHSILLQVAGDDPVVDAERAQSWFKNIDKNKVDATLKVYPGFLHEIYNESKKEEAINDFISWLNRKCDTYN